ncbi:MAG: class I SAM-dependent methyltransferase [Propionibacteriaceae bacterium]|jgi:hypothetical protein|nr:class I SAM-dependent methyltransferase [Propionibacteriaceae bacterium]
MFSSRAAVFCTSDHVDPEDCSWYHGTWQYLRMLDMVATPSWHSYFYETAFNDAFETGCRSVLISGTADYCLLAHILRASAWFPDVAITVTDLCQTPLESCKWFAERHGVEIATTASNICEHWEDYSGSFDLITSDAFLTRFTDDMVDKVLKCWNRLLSDHGRVVTTVRVHHPQSTDDSGLKAELYALRAQAAMEALGDKAPISPGEMFDRALTFATSMVSHSLGSSKEVLDRVQKYFHVLSAEEDDVPGQLERTRYLRLELSKRDLP